MTKIISLNEFKKFNIRIGEVRKLTEESAEIFCENKTFTYDRKNVDLEVGDKIVIFITDNECTLLVVRVDDAFIPVVPEKDIELGSRVE